ncbi:acyl-CoA dehydrogenase family protein [Halomarina halobia]|uniref:Acyl-CoA dehydrogenase family protein n=1 Tax=Halomarina halobia TaxID=3033386 RepID=A0ABD6AD02_9EURY|nr:acyl-CoA dehydrogenase family protein [Halomarina sp. PSR21]
MNFEYDDEHEAFRRELREWLAENLPAGWRDGEREMLEGDEREQFLRDWQRTLYDGGWAGVHWPEEYGGRGASLIEQTIYREEMARANAPPQINVIGINFVGPTLVAAGTEAQKERFVPNILSGEEIWCQGYSEPDAGSDIASLTTRAEKQGDQWVINGQKIWTSYAQYADWCFLVARTDDSGLKHEGITTLLVDIDQEGVSMDPIHQASDEEGFNQVYFDDAVTSADNIVGEVGRGWEVVMTLSAFEHSTTTIFSIEQNYLDLLEYCRTETRAGEPLIEDARVRRKLADLDARVQAAKVSHYRNVSERSETGTPGPEGSMDLVVADELRNDLTNVAMDVLGPETALWEDGPNDGRLADDYLGSYGSWIAAGTGDIQRNIIGERVLGLPKDDKSQESHRT